MSLRLLRMMVSDGLMALLRGRGLTLAALLIITLTFSVSALALLVAGNLAAAVTLMARDRGGPAIRFQLLIYPVTDAGFEWPSYRENGEGYLLSRRGMQWFWDQYVPDLDQRREPYAAPLRAAHFEGLPPALVQTAGFDPLRDEGEAYASRLRDAGVATTATRFDGMIHGFFTMGAVLDAGARAVDEAASELRAA